MKMTDMRAKARAIFGPAIAEPMPKQPNGAKALQERANARPIPTYKVGGVVKKSPPQPTAAEREADRKRREEYAKMKVTPENAATIGRGNRSSGYKDGGKIAKYKQGDIVVTGQRRVQPDAASDFMLERMMQQPVLGTGDGMGGGGGGRRPITPTPLPAPASSRGPVISPAVIRQPSSTLGQLSGTAAPKGYGIKGTMRFKKGGDVHTSSDTARKLATEMGGMKKGGKAKKDGLAVMIAIGSPMKGMKKPVKKMHGGRIHDEDKIVNAMNKVRNS